MKKMQEKVHSRRWNSKTRGMAEKQLNTTSRSRRGIKPAAESKANAFEAKTKGYPYMETPEADPKRHHIAEINDKFNLLMSW